MKYALGNMLNGAGGLNADQLALDLQFAADKTLTARRGPSPILTRGSTGTFVGSNGLIQTAASGAARFDHDPVTLASRGLLIEEGRTNDLIRSQDFGNAAWIASGTGAAKIGTSSLTDPEGSLNAYEINVGTAVGISNVRQTFTPSLTSQNRTMSVYVRVASGTSVFRLAIWTGSALIASSNFTATTTWTRFSFNFTGVVSQFQITTGTAGGTVSNIHVWGAQLEVGAFETSYIPTTTSALARSADVCSITGANFTNMWNASEGSVFIGVIPYAPQNISVNQFIIDIGDGGSANRTRLFRAQTSGATTLTGTSSNVTDLSITGALLATLVLSKLSFGMKLNDFALSKDGALSGTDTTANMMAASTTMVIGNSSVAAQHVNGTISAIRYYRKRLANAKLQALTA